MAVDESANQPADLLPTAALRRALTFGLGVVAVRRAARPPLPVPAELGALRSASPTKRSLDLLRRVVDNDVEFRAILAEQASPSLVDEIGLLWLRRPDDWERQAAMLLADQSPHAIHRIARQHRAVEADNARLAAELESSRAAEALRSAQLAERSAQCELLARQLSEVEAARAAALVDAARAEERAAAEIATWQQRLAEALAEHDAQFDRAAAQDRLIDGLRDELEAARGVRDAALADLAEWSAGNQSAGQAGNQAGSAAGEPLGDVRPLRRQTSRRAVPIPGGLLASSADAAEYLLAVSGAVVLVDGYNVAKLGWPDLELPTQRHAVTVAAEAIARRFGRRIEVLFDGADVAGAPGRGRHLVHVGFSAPGVSADDLIRARIGELPIERTVIVVTDDRQIVADARRAGCNIIASAVLLAVAHRGATTGPRPTR